MDERTDTFPEDFSDLVIVPDRDTLFKYRRAKGESAVLLPRRISGQFNDLAFYLHRQHKCRNDIVIEDDGSRRPMETYYRLDDLLKHREDYSMVWARELDLICADMDDIQKRLGVTAELRVVAPSSYKKSTYEFHQDSENYRWLFNAHELVLCGYNGPTTEAIKPEDAIACKKGTDIYFEKRPGAPVFHFGIGDVWRQAGLSRGLIHRAAETKPGDPPRLLLVC